MEVSNYPEYQVYGDGTVIGARGKPLKPDPNSTGYLRVTLSKNGKAERFFVHRLVAEHFIGRPSVRAVINHIDGDNQNNRVDNLEWCTPSYNVKDRWNRGRDSSHLYLNLPWAKQKVQRLSRKGVGSSDPKRTAH